MHDDGSRSPERRDAVRILSVPLVGEIAVLFAGPLQGLLVHRVQGRPKPCPGSESCPISDHRSRTLWYGYAPAYVWRPSAESWSACVLEITEALEELLHGRTLRGEVWLLQRFVQKKKQGPCGGVLLETRQGAEIPAVFDVMAPLCRLYHSQDLRLGVPNPLPRKLVLPAARLPAPPGPGAFGLDEPPRPTAQNAEALNRIAPRGFKAAFDDQAKKNGHEKR